MFIEALFTIAKIYNQPKCSSIHDWIKKIIFYIVVCVCKFQTPNLSLLLPSGNHKFIFYICRYSQKWIYTQEWNCWVIWQFYFQFFEKLPYCFPQWLDQFTFLPTVYQGLLFSVPMQNNICYLCPFLMLAILTMLS